VPAVAVAQPGVFPGEVERPPGPRAGNQLVGIPLEPVHAFQDAGPVEVAAQRVEAVQEAAAVLDLGQGHPAGQGQVLDGEGRAVRVAAGLEGVE
jgi:hypothetical protein